MTTQPLPDHPSVTPPGGPRPQDRRWNSALIASACVLAVMVVAMYLESRIWWCKCGEATIWISDVWTSHCSQHLLDPYSFSHFSHGLIFAGLFGFIGARRRWPVPWQLFTSITTAAAWEVAENSPFVINRYRTVTMSLDYLGDSIINAVGDVLCCILGFFVARKLGTWKTIALFAIIEIVMLVTMKDNLTLNVIMLISPIQAIKNWQTAGHLPPA